MFGGGRDQELANTIGNILLDILPPDAVTIVANSEVEDDTAATDIEFTNDAGVVGYFSFEELPRQAIGDINEAVMDLREVMSQGGGAAWNRSTFTAHRDGKFNVEFSYKEADSA